MARSMARHGWRPVPLAPKRPCAVSGCPNALPCEAHPLAAPQQHAGKTVDERRFYSSWRWTQASLRHRDHEPLCRQCAQNGIVKAGVLVDHIVPIRHGCDPWNEENWQTLCGTCHNRKRQQEARGIVSGGGPVGSAMR